MSALIVRTLLKTPLDDNLVGAVLEMIEGFAPEGVKKADWKNVLLGWQQASHDVARYMDPAKLRGMIESKNNALGPLQWYVQWVRIGRQDSEPELRADLNIDKRLEGQRVMLNRGFGKRPAAESCKILQVKDTAFQHDWLVVGEYNFPRKNYWCKRSSVRELYVLIEWTHFRFVWP